MNLVVLFILFFLTFNNVFANEHLIKDDLDGKMLEHKYLKKPFFSKEQQALKEKYDLSFASKIEMQNQFGDYSSADFKQVIGSDNKLQSI